MYLGVSFFDINKSLLHIKKKENVNFDLLEGCRRLDLLESYEEWDFEVKSFYKEVHAGPGSLFPWKSLWKVNVLPKGSVFYLGTGFGTDSYFE